MACKSCGARKRAQAKKTTAKSKKTTAKVTPASRSNKAETIPAKGQIVVDGMVLNAESTNGEFAPKVNVAELNQNLRVQYYKELKASKRRFGNNVKVKLKVNDKKAK